MKSSISLSIAIVVIVLVGALGFILIRHFDGTNVGSGQTICDVTNDELPQSESEVRLNGRLRGFHYLVMTDSRCETPGSALLVDLDGETRRQFVLEVLDRDQFAFDRGGFDFNVEATGLVCVVNRSDSTAPCYVPDNGILNPEIRYCLRVSSIRETRIDTGRE